ncbi:AAA family ATPase [Pseudomonas hunanensis]|uniref:AAA family ATPase n=1 Tax=Pseudomonas hunanensis TaxID=1247546 RepID=UPI0030DC5306
MTPPLLFLPLLATQADELAQGKIHPTTAFATWGDPELAVVAVIQKLPALAGQAQSDMQVEKALADLVKIGQQLAESQPAGTFAALLAARFEIDAFARGLSLLPKVGARFMEEDAFSAKEYLLESGQWDFDFRARYAEKFQPLKHVFNTPSEKEFRLSDQQARTFRMVIAEPDESIHIQGLAGTGKTHLIETFVDSLSACRPLFLAFTKTQLGELTSRVGRANTVGMTFGDLADYVLSRDPNYVPPGRRASSRHQVQPSEIAERLNIKGIATFTPAQVASLCTRMVAAFAYSQEINIGIQHIPRGIRLSSVDAEVLVKYAQLVWNETILPTAPGLYLPLRGYHRIKHMTLSSDAVISREFTHIIVDEAHDLSKSLADFLDRCPQPVITLGDAYQRLDGSFYARAGNLRKHEITRSIRSGCEIESVINPLIDKHPVLQLAGLEGNGEINTKVVYYDSPEIPDGPVTILVDSEWGLFEWFQRLGAKNARFSLLAGSEATFRRFILDCIGLYHEQIRPTHSALFRFGSWHELRAAIDGENGSFLRIERMLSKGYKAVDFENSWFKLDQSGHAPIKLGRVADARNSEIPTVMLAPDLLGAPVPGDRVGVSRAFAALYTGGTRAQRKLIVPGYLKDWITDASRSAGRSAGKL